MIFFEEQGEGFESEICVVACYVLHEGKFILLQRQTDKTHGGKWGLPAGKLEEGESTVSAIIREVFEETGIVIVEEDLTKLQTLWVRNNGHDIEYHTFSAELNAEPFVVVNATEHQDFTWVTPKDSLEMDLIHDLGECNKLFFNL